MAPRTYADFQKALRAARVVYDHSQARMVNKMKKVRRTKKMAFLSAIPASNLAIDSRQDTNGKTSSHHRKHTLKARNKDSSKSVEKTVENVNTQIFIRTPLASTICLQLQSSTSILAVKELIQDQVGIEATKQHLFTKSGFELCDALSLADQSIDRDTNLDLRLVPGLLGGRKKRKPGKKPKSAAESAPSHRKDATKPDVTPAGETVTSSKSTTCHVDDSGGICHETVDSGLPVHMSEWNRDHVRRWLLSIDIPAGIAAEFHSQEIDGVVMERYTEHELKIDFKLNTRNLRRILHCKMDWLESEKRPESTSDGASPDVTPAVDRPTATYITTEKSQVAQGNMRDCTFNHYEMTINSDVLHNGVKVDELAKEILSELQQIRTCGNERKQMLQALLEKSDAFLWKTQPGSIRLIVRVKSRAGLDKLWKAYISGDLAKSLTDILITDQLIKTEDKSAFAIKVAIEESDYEQGCNFFDGLLKGLPTSMMSWTPQHVHIWLLSIGVEQAIAKQLLDGNISGKMLAMYTEDDLNKDYNMMPQHEMHLILSSRDTWLKGEGLQVMGSREVSGRQQKEPHHSLDVGGSNQDHHLMTDTPLSVRPKTRKSRERSQIMTEVESASNKQKTNQALMSTPKSPINVKSTVPMTEEKEQVRSDETEEPDRMSERSPLKAIVKPFQVPQEEKSTKHQTTKYESPRSQSLQEKKTPSGDRTPEYALHDSQNTEARLRKLLTGDKYGEIDQSHYPVLIANKPPVQPEQSGDGDPIREQFEFINTIRWTTVLDFDAHSLTNGLCKLYHDDRMVTLQQPELFKQVKSEEEFRNSIEFPEKTLWVFANGRKDNPNIPSPKMTLPEWHKERRSDVEASITFFCQPSVIPQGRAVLLFLLLSEDDIEIICEAFGKLTSSLQGVHNFTCIAEDPQIYFKFVRRVEKWFSKDEIDERSVVGIKWREINSIMKRIHGVNQTATNELPLYAGGSCYLSEKQKNTWDDLTVVCKNECENTDMNESNQGFENFKTKKELNFYRGDKVDWWNFAISDSERGCGHVLKRKGFEETLRKITKALDSRRKDESLITSVTLLHQPGAGGSTLARHVLWELHRRHRCIVVDRITTNTAKQIMEVRRYGYQTEHSGRIPPVCVLLDDLDDVDVLHLIRELEEVSRVIFLDGGALCVLLQCKRTADPSPMIDELADEDRDLCIPLTQKLTQNEKEWCTKKYRELESKESQFRTGVYNPENLIAFMVMKEEFNKEYITKVVSRILHQDDIQPGELKLIKYCALLNTYKHDAKIPISCCDFLMAGKLKSKKATALTHRKLSSWEKMVSASFRILVMMTENRAIKMFHKSIAEEVLRQTLHMCDDQPLVSAILEFLNCNLLTSQSYSKRDLFKTVHAVLIKREKLGPGDARTDFSAIIEDVYGNSEKGPEEAIGVLKVGFEILVDPFVAQQLARLYLKMHDFKMAQTFADEALKIEPEQSYFWDTKGRVFQRELQSLSAHYVSEHQVLKGEDCKKYISLAFKAMDAFRKSYEFSKKAWLTEYAGLFAEIHVAFQLLQVVHWCVEPFRSKQDINSLRLYLLDQTTKIKPEWDKDSHFQIGKLKNRLDSLLEEMDNNLTYYKDGSSANIYGKKLEELRDKMKEYMKTYKHYYGVPSKFHDRDYRDLPPTSLAECRRRNVKDRHCSRFGDIFDQNRDINDLEQARKELLKNSGAYDFFDLKTLICIYLALSSRGKALDMSADDVYEQLVRPLNALDQGKNCWPPFFMMMFLWPIQDAKSERRDREKFSFYVDNLRDRWDAYKSADQQWSRQEKRQTRFPMKPRTHFFFGHGDGLKVFVHINELHAAKHAKGEYARRDVGDDEFWKSPTLKDRLVTLKGTLQNKKTLQHHTKKGHIFKIKLAVPYGKHVPSQENVTFYLGFSWDGPVAYNVSPEGKECEDTTPFHFSHAYPRHLLPPSNKSRSTPRGNESEVRRLRGQLRRLDRELANLHASRRGERETKTSKSEIERRIAEIKEKLHQTLNLEEKDSGYVYSYVL